MTINWTGLLNVVAVSFSATIAVVVLMALAMLGLSARRAPLVSVRSLGRPAHPHGLHSRRTGTTVAVACLGATAVIVLAALYQVVAH